MRRLLLASAAVTAAFAAGCSGDPDRDTVRVTIETGTPPALLAFRDATTTDWQAREIAGARAFELEATGPYEVAIVCASEGPESSVYAAHYARTPSDDPAIEHSCRTADAPPFVVRGRMVQPGMVSFDTVGQGTTASNWDFEFDTYPGTFDLVVLTGDISTQVDRIAIQRDIAVIDDTDLGTIDLPAERTQALVPTLFTASNFRPGESLSASTIMNTPSTTAYIDSSSSAEQSGWSMLLAPDSALLPTDRQRVRLNAHESAGAQDRYRGVLREVRVGDPTSVMLPEPLGPVQFAASPGRLAAQWSELPEYDELSLVRHSYSSNSLTSRTHIAAFSRSFLEATGATTIALDFREVPGFQSAWDHAPGHDEYRDFSASRGPASDRYDAGVTEWIGATNQAARRSEAARRTRGEP